MWQRSCTVLSLVVASVFFVLSVVAADAATVSRPAWLSDSEPVVAKTLDLPDGQEPLGTSIDCEPVEIPNGSGTRSCAYDTPIGKLAGLEYMLGTPHGTVGHDAHAGGWVLPSVPNRPGMIITQPSGSSSARTLRVGDYKPGLLKYSNQYKKYEYLEGFTKNDRLLRGADSTPGTFTLQNVAYSANGGWLVARTESGGLARYNLDTLEGRVITWDTSGFSYNFGHTKMNNLAVSDDGRFVAMSVSVTAADGQKRPSLRVYDVDSCRDQYKNYSSRETSHACEYKDLWTGEYRTGNSQGIRDVLPTAEYPRRVRFVANNTLNFDTIYDRTDVATYKVARYSVTMPETPSREYVGVLGMGDSYISGEGAAGKYWQGTDTANNKCHQSWTSYPYWIGAEQFQYGRSVACSGAKMFDVSLAAGDPAKKVEKEGDYIGKNKKKWSEHTPARREQYMASFSPGYAQQIMFAREYKPRTVLLSVGGNDIRFASLLASCVDPRESPSTCYPYYEDRLQIMQQIIGQYDRLVKTYKSVLQESGGRLYVVAYPQIAKVDGDCGVNVKLDSAEVKFGSQLVTYLNGVIKRAAAEAGAYYVDTENALSGYRLCEAPKGKAAMNGVTKGNDSGPFKLLGQESYHPTVFGHKLLSQSVTAKTSSLTAAMPKPKPNNKPALDMNNPLLQAARAPREDAHTESLQWSENTAPPVLQKGKKYQTNIPQGSLKQDSNIKGVLHSTPTTVFESRYDQGSPLVFEIPESVEPGYHRFDIYGTDPDGLPVDLREIIYVAETEKDYDGDGVPNASDPCVILGQSGKDEDADGVDDACDGVIGAEESEGAPVLPPAESLPEDEPDSQLEPHEGSIFVPYVPPTPVPAPPREQTQPPGQSTHQQITNPALTGAVKAVYQSQVRNAGPSTATVFAFSPVEQFVLGSDMVPSQAAQGLYLSKTAPKQGTKIQEELRESAKSGSNVLVVVALSAVSVFVLGVWMTLRRNNN